MKRLLSILFLMMLLPGFACAEDAAHRALQSVDLTEIYEYAKEYGADESIRNLLESSLEGKMDGGNDFIEWLKARVADPVRRVFKQAGAILPVILLSALLGFAAQGKQGGAAFLLRIQLLLAFAGVAETSLAEAENCISEIGRFSDLVAPVLTALMSAMGMDAVSAMVSPAAAMAGNIAVQVFLKYGVPLCRAGLCMALAGGFGTHINLNRFTRMIRKTANWGSGLAITLFTTLLTLQGGMAESFDGVAVRTARYAVDSAAPVIGSSISDAWDSYISGLLVAKNAVGISGVAALLAAGAQPIILCFCSMVVLNIAAALLDLFGETLAGSAAEQIAGICQMALSLCTGAMAICVILLGAAMAAGKGLVA